MPEPIFRLRPGDDLRTSLQDFVNGRGLGAAWVITCVGSLTEAHLRFANRDEGTPLDGPFEILHLAGTLSTAGSHLHVTLGDGEGRVVGGHLLETGNTIRTTAEVVLGCAEGVAFGRELDESTGHKELVVR